MVFYNNHNSQGVVNCKVVIEIVNNRDINRKDM
jgi:hypothetical protein